MRFYELFYIFQGYASTWSRTLNIGPQLMQKKGWFSVPTNCCRKCTVPAQYKVSWYEHNVFAPICDLKYTELSLDRWHLIFPCSNLPLVTFESDCSNTREVVLLQCVVIHNDEKNHGHNVFMRLMRSVYECKIYIKEFYIQLLTSPLPFFYVTMKCCREGSGARHGLMWAEDSLPCDLWTHTIF